MTDLLFVYGTLRSKFEIEPARLLRSEGELMGPASVRGAIYNLGSYPAYRAEPAGEVRGELFRLHNPESTLRTLDEYEGDQYERVLIETALGKAWIYSYKAALPDRLRISSGDFCEE